MFGIADIGNHRRSGKLDLRRRRSAECSSRRPLRRTGFAGGGADLHGAALTGASLDGVEALGLVIGCDESVRPLTCPFGDLRDVQFEDGDSLAGSDLRYAKVSGMTVFDMDFSGVLLDGALVLDSRWTQVNTRGLGAVEARFSGSRWQRVNLTDADLRRSQWADVDLSTENARILYDASMQRSGAQGAALTGSICSVPVSMMSA
jgi:uncharacterized protein YjbI with pentapeptide repeats